ncbi:hypothetical protein ACFV2X_38230 [Streptomyces sp. NPDC059679]|uniref:hypothetical protein n=1 Tax=Streptomyces sp. NPDC059679 TaxID=3346903 RepID=UPI0036A866CA
MTTTTVEDRADLAEDLLPIAAHLAVLVHGDGGPRDVHQALARLSPAQRDALVVVLAGLVDPDQPISSALGWLDFNEHGQQIVPAWGHKGTLRELSEDAVEDDWDGVDMVAVDYFLRGRPVQLSNRAEKVEAILEGLRRGMGYRELDALFGVKRGTTQVFIQRERKAAEERGESFPVELLPTSGQKVTPAQVVEMREQSAKGRTDLAIAMSVGLSCKQVSSILNGEYFPQAGGPIREKKKRRPSEASRVLFNGGTPGFAIAS